MPTGRFDTAVPFEAERGPVRRPSGPGGARTAPGPHQDPRGWMPPGAAVGPHSRVLAAALLQDGGGRPDRAGSALLALQRAYGNRHVQQLVWHTRRVPAVQAKLLLGPPADRYEREADQVARQVARAPGPVAARVPNVQRLQGGGHAAVDAAVEHAVQGARCGGRALPGAVRARMEQALGADLGGVRVHTGAQADQLNDALRSRAFTVGGDVFVRSGAYRPGTPAGDELLAHELTHTIQQGASSPCSAPGPAAPATTPTVQRLFGFELELGVLLTRDGNAGAMDKPRSNPYPKVGTATDGTFEAHIDHSTRLNNLVPENVRSAGGAPILELVTAPIDEFAGTEQDVRDVMDGLVAVADHIKTNAIDANARIPLDGVPGVAADPAATNFVGVHATNPILAGVQSTSAYVQSTYGVSLRRVPQEFGTRATEPGSVVAANNKQALLVARAHADAMVQWVLDRYGSRKHGIATQRTVANQYRFTSPAELDETRGLFALIAYYLEVGKLNPHVQDLIKKKVGIFYFKTRLSTVRNQLTAADPKLKWLLTSRRDKVVQGLLNVTARDAGDEVITTAGVNCATWLDEVLAGKRDTVFDRSVNPYSKELKAPDIGQGAARGAGVVMENRKFAATEGKNEVMGRYAPNTWADVAVRVRRRLRDLQGG